MQNSMALIWMMYIRQQQSENLVVDDIQTYSLMNTAGSACNAGS